MKTAFLWLVILMGASQIALCDSNSFSQPSRQGSEAYFREMPPARIASFALIQLEQKNYLKLEGLAAFYRSTKLTLADGSWKLKYVYSGLIPPEGAKDEVWNRRLNEITNWISVFPDSATARIAWANVMTDYAWKARGGDWGSKVTAEGRQLFCERLAHAQAMLDSVKPLQTKCPQYWSVALTCALGRQPPSNNRYDLQIDWFANVPPEMRAAAMAADKAAKEAETHRTDSYDALFNEAVHAEPDWTDYYFQRALFYLPRWHGKPGQWQQGLSKAADNIGGEKGDMMYAQVIWAMEQMLGMDPLSEGSIDLDRIRRGFAGIEKQFPEDTMTAEKDLARLLRAKDEAAAVGHYRKGLVTQDETEKMAEFDEAIRLSDNMGEVYGHRGSLKLSKGDLDGALADFDRAIALRHDEYMAQFITERGDIKLQRGNTNGALADYSYAIKVDPTQNDAFFHRAQIKQARKDYSAALGDYNRAIWLQRFRPHYYRARGELLMLIGNTNAAAEDFKAAENEAFRNSRAFEFQKPPETTTEEIHL